MRDGGTAAVKSSGRETEIAPRAAAPHVAALDWPFIAITAAAPFCGRGPRLPRQHLARCHHPNATMVTPSEPWPAPEDIPRLPFTVLERLFSHLLCLNPALARTLAAQCAAAMAERVSASPPRSFDALLVVARACVDDDPGWTMDEKRTLATSQPPVLSSLHGRYCPPPVQARLERLSRLYQCRYPGQVFVPHSLRSPVAVADEMASVLGTAACADAETFPLDLVVPKDTPEWHAELARNLDAVWVCAHARISSLSNKSAPPSHNLAQEELPARDEQPFISLATFRMLALSSPVLESFFESDLQSSFSLVSPERSESGGAHTWHVSPAGKQDSSNASYSKDVTPGARGKVVGFLGGWLGEEGKARMDQLADSVGQRLQTHAVSGPVPSFGRDTTLDGTAMDQASLRAAEEERRRLAEEALTQPSPVPSSFGLGSRLAGIVRSTTGAAGGVVSSFSSSRTPQPSGSPARSPAPTLNHTPRPIAQATPKPDTARAPALPVSLRSDDLSLLGPDVVAEALRAAAMRERSHFTMDDVKAEPAEEADEPEGELDDLPEEKAEVDGRLSGRDAELAKDLRSAPAAQ